MGECGVWGCEGGGECVSVGVGSVLVWGWSVWECGVWVWGWGSVEM